MATRFLIVGLFSATAVGLAISGWALLQAENDTRFQPEVVNFNGGEPDIAPTPISEASPTAEAAPPGLPAPQSWPPPDLRERAIALTLADSRTTSLVAGHRYGAFVVDLHRSKTGRCSDNATLSCAQVAFYDYSASSGVRAIVDMMTSEVLDVTLAPDFQPGTTPEELTNMARIIAQDPTLGSGFQIDTTTSWVTQIDDTDLGGKCGQVSPLHRCLQVKARGPDGLARWVIVDLVEETVVRTYREEE